MVLDHCPWCDAIVEIEPDDADAQLRCEACSIVVPFAADEIAAPLVAAAA